jgi:6-phosphogluconolactonase (cycloisomerase 2 family)
VFFVSNTATNNLSSFGLGPNGQPILLSAVAATTNPGPIDLAGSGRFLYAETGINGTVDEFRIGPNGTLTPIGSVDDLPPGIEGIAAT